MEEPEEAKPSTKIEKDMSVEQNTSEKDMSEKDEKKDLSTSIDIETSNEVPAAGSEQTNGTVDHDKDEDQHMEDTVEIAAEAATESAAEIVAEAAAPIEEEEKEKEKAGTDSIDTIKTSVSEDSEEEEEDSETQEDSLREVVGDLEIDMPSPVSPANKDDSAVAAEDTGEAKEGEESQPDKHKPMKVKAINMTELGCCEYCGGPVKKRRLASPLKRFCSKACARAFRRPKIKRDDESGQESEESTGGGSELAGESKMTWDDYLEAAQNKAAPDGCFRHSTLDVPGLKPGMKLEAVDRNNPPSFCVATVIQCLGHRVGIRYDGYGGDSSNDIWCNFQAEELHPIGWCAQNGYPLQSPKGVGSNLEDWRTFLTQTLTGALAAPQDLFRKGHDIFQPRVHGFEVGMKLEAVHPLKPSIICPATVTKSLGPYYFAITPDYQHDLPSTTVCCHSDSPGIFPVGWCYRNGVELTFPANYTKKTFSWDKYLALCRATVAPSQLFKQKVKAHKFKVGMKVEAVDLEQPSVIRVATITNVIGRLLQLFFDGQSRFQFVDVESPDIYPIGWCRKTVYPLSTPFGIMPQDSKATIKPQESEPLHLPSFDEVMGRQAISTSTTTVAILPRKPVTTRADKEKEKCDDKDIDLDDKSGDSDISEDDPLERFYHNKNQIFFNKTCCIGPLLDPEKIKFLQDSTPPGKVSTVIRMGLEMVAKAAFDPEKVIDLMQEGCGVRVVVRHKGKLLKKAISRVDSRPKLERYLKRFCRRLICCEYFLSLKPIGQPCPDQCKADEQGNLQGPKGLKAKRSREYFEVKHLGLEKKKRGRKRKSELHTNGAPLLKKVVNENGIPVVTPILPTSAMHNRTLAPAYHLHQNGSVVRPAVAAGSMPGVQAPVVRFQGSRAPGTLTVRPASTNPQIAPRPQAIAPAPSNPRLIAPAMTSTIVKKEGMLGHNRPLVMTDMPGSSKKPHASGIITNISGQRFATSSGTSGTTITFGRPPPNVTICSSSVPPPLLTRHSDTNTAINIPSVHGSISGYPRGPPNVVVSSGQSVVTSGGTMQMSLSEGGPLSGGVIRAPIVVPPQVKQEGLPPPPLLHSAKHPHGSRVQGRPVTSQSAVSSSFSQSRPYDPRSPGGQRSPRPLYTTPGTNTGMRPPPAASSHSRSFGMSHGVTTSNQRPIIPNYQGFPRPQGVPGTLQAPHGGIRQGHGNVTGGQGTSTVIGNVQAKPGVIQTIHHNPAGSSSISHIRPIAMATGPPSSSYADTTTLRKIRPGPISLPKGSERRPNSAETDRREFGLHDERDLEDDDIEHAEELGEDKPEMPKKRNLWWLKKKRRKKARLTLIKPKRRKDDEPGTSEVLTVKDEPMEEETADHLQHYDAGGELKKSKRGRVMSKELVLRLAGDEEGVFAIGDEGDPDWDESFERKKIKQPIKKKGMGRGGRREGGPELSPSPFPSPTSPFQLPSPVNNPYVRRVGSRLVATLPSEGPINFTSPGPVRSSVSPELPSNSPNSYQKSLRGGRSASFSSPDGRGRGTSNSQFPPRSAIRSSSSSQPPVSPRSPAPPRPTKSIGINTSLPGCVNGRSPDLPPNPVMWSVEHVVSWVRSTDCTNYAAIFVEEEIDGQSLMMLSRDSLMQFTPMKLGPTLKMCSYIAQLKLRAR